MVKMVLPIILIFLFTYASAQQKQTESRDVEFYFNRGLGSYWKGQYDQAISDCTKALEINPRNAAAYNNRGIAYFHKREYEKSWKDVEKAQSLGYQIQPKFLDDLRKASGRQN
jgi:tetratricopeptide (TPR) repeat protein